jgi:hypothetical protein
LPALLMSWHGNPPVTTDHSGGQPAHAKPSGEPPMPQNRCTCAKGASAASSIAFTSAHRTSPAGSEPSATRASRTAQAVGEMSV